MQAPLPVITINNGKCDVPRDKQGTGGSLAVETPATPVISSVRADSGDKINQKSDVGAALCTSVATSHAKSIQRTEEQQQN